MFTSHYEEHLRRIAHHAPQPFGWSDLAKRLRGCQGSKVIGAHVFEQAHGELSSSMGRLREAFMRSP
jgi:hypothetical protein